MRTTQSKNYLLAGLHEWFVRAGARQLQREVGFNRGADIRLATRVNAPTSVCKNLAGNGGRGFKAVRIKFPA